MFGLVIGGADVQEQTLFFAFNLAFVAQVVNALLFGLDLSTPVNAYFELAPGSRRNTSWLRSESRDAHTVETRQCFTMLPDQA